MPPRGIESRLYQALAALAEELWVAKDRQRALEAILSRNGTDVHAELERFQPDADLSAELDAERQRFIAAVMAPFGEDNESA